MSLQPLHDFNVIPKVDGFRSVCFEFVVRHLRVVEGFPSSSYQLIDLSLQGACKSRELLEILETYKILQRWPAKQRMAWKTVFKSVVVF